MIIVFLGAPGVGKGTQSLRVSKALGVPHISTGDILRDNIRRKTDIGLQITETMSNGSLVIDDIVIQIVKERIKMPDCKQGFILDGFPRTINQAKKLDEMCNVNCAVSIFVSNDIIISRMKGRYVCPICKATYNINGNRPKIENVCDNCSSALVRREEDKPEALKNRLSIFRTQSMPIEQYYKQQQKFFEVDGTEPVDEITAGILDVLAKVEENVDNN